MHGYVGRVRAVDEESDTLYVELRSGQIVTIEDIGSPAPPAGTTVVVDSEFKSWDEAPSALWPRDDWVGVVRLRRDDVTVVDNSGRWKLVPTNREVDYSAGNTVLVEESDRVVRVLSKDPIKYFELPAIDRTVVERFKVDPDASSPTFDDFGGLREVVERAQELIEISLRHKQALTAIGAKRIKGVLFTGLPGTGKTLLARVIAGATDATFYEISGPEIFSKWYGQSEEVLRRLFEDASSQEAAVIFFDEIDSVAGQRGDDTHEASRRVVAQLLTLMDGFNPDNNVIVIAATNRPQDIDVALRRPGRFDWEIHFPLPQLTDRRLILEASARKLATAGVLPHEWVAARTNGWSAAELAAIWSEAALFAAADDRRSIAVEDYFCGFERVAAQRTRAMRTAVDDGS